MQTKNLLLIFICLVKPGVEVGRGGGLAATDEERKGRPEESSGEWAALLAVLVATINY